jgi:hypothetical protein
VSPRSDSWTREEIALLAADYAAYVPVPEIAAKLGRGIPAVRQDFPARPSPVAASFKGVAVGSAAPQGATRHHAR